MNKEGYFLNQKILIFHVNLRTTVPFVTVLEIFHCTHHSLILKVIRFDPLAPVKTTVLLLPTEWKMPDFINNIE